MKIVYTGARCENYDSNRFPSFEYNNFFGSLKNIPEITVIEHPYEITITQGKKAFNEQLFQIVENEKPDIMFAFMFSDELDEENLKRIKQKTTTIGWFADDHWRIHSYSRKYAPCFTWAITTWSQGPKIYEKYGIKNIIRSQWGYKGGVEEEVPFDETKKDIAVSFIGQANRARKKIVNTLKEANINVATFGYGWPAGRITFEKTQEIIKRSKINLNINTPIPWYDPQRIGRIILTRHRNKFVLSADIENNIKGYFSMNIPQIKARPFELAGAGGFVLTPMADDFTEYYIPDKEMVFYNNTQECISNIKYYLSKKDAREKIAYVGHQRTIREHLYSERFRDIFSIIAKNKN